MSLNNDPIRKSRTYGDNEPIGLLHDGELIQILWERGVSPTEVAEYMAWLQESYDADMLRKGEIDAQ